MSGATLVTTLLHLQRHRTSLFRRSRKETQRMSNEKTSNRRKQRKRWWVLKILRARRTFSERFLSLTTSLRMVVVVGKATSSMRISCLLLRLRQGLESLARLQRLLLLLRTRRLQIRISRLWTILSTLDRIGCCRVTFWIGECNINVVVTI